MHIVDVSLVDILFMTAMTGRKKGAPEATPLYEGIRDRSRAHLTLLSIKYLSIEATVSLPAAQVNHRYHEGYEDQCATDEQYHVRAGHRVHCKTARVYAAHVD